MPQDKTVTAKKEVVQKQDDDMLVWAFKPLAQLNMQTGFVTCKESLATKLINEGKVQHPDEGALNFKEIETGNSPVQSKPSVQPDDEDKEVKNEQKKVIEPPKEETK